LTVGFRLSWSLRLSRILFTNSSSFHDRILAITKPFTRNFSFFTMEFWLSRSLHTNFFLFHDGILAIKKPFTRTFFFHMVESRLSRSLSHELFSFFSRWNSGYQGVFHTNFFLFSRGGNSAITEPFHEFFFHMTEFLKKMHDLEEDSFHIYDKEYLHRIRLVKNLAS
jgi:hypothetical protein